MLRKFLSRPLLRSSLDAQAASSPRDKLSAALLAIAVFVGAFFRLYNLSGVGFLVRDEKRALASLHSYGGWQAPFFSICYKIPLKLFGYHQSTAILTTAVLGIVLIVAIYLMGRRLFGPRAGAYAAFFAAFSPTLIAQSRSGYPFSLQALILIVVFYILIVVSEGKKHVLLPVLCAGLFFALAFATYAPSYMAVVPMGILLVLCLMKSLRSLPKAISYSLLFLAAFCAVLAVFHITSHAYGKSYFSILFSYQARAAIQGSFSSQTAGIFALKRNLGFFLLHDRLWFPLLGIPAFVALILGSGNKRRHARLLVCFIALSFGVYAASYIAGLTNPAPRRLVFLIPFIALAAGRGLQAVRWRIARHSISIILVSALLVNGVFFFSVYQRQIYRVDPILKWLDAHHIKKSTVVSDVVLWGGSDSSKAVFLPYSRKDKIKNGEYIDWEKIESLAAEKDLRYLLVIARRKSRILKVLQNYDKEVTPLESWPGPKDFWGNPYNRYCHTIKLYNLQPILKARNKLKQE